MDVSSLKAKIQAKKIPNFLIFSGQEWEVQKVYIQQIAKVQKQEVVRIDAISDIYAKLKNKLIAQTAACYVVRDDRDIMTNEKLQRQLDELIGKNTLVLLLTEVDKRTKFYKQYQDIIIDFEPLPDNILVKYIQKRIPLSGANCEKLIDVCEHNYGRILLEIDKIEKYMEAVNSEGSGQRG